jgi:hypothetical protein
VCITSRHSAASNNYCGIKSTSKSAGQAVSQLMADRDGFSPTDFSATVRGQVLNMHPLSNTLAPSTRKKSQERKKKLQPSGRPMVEREKTLIA